MINLWKKQDEYTLNNKKIVVSRMTFSELLDITFLVLPYIKVIRKIKAEYKSSNRSDIFRFVVQTLLADMSKDDIYTAFSIGLRVPVDEIKKAPVEELILIVPSFIRKNNLLNVFLLLRRLGLLDG